MKLPWFQRAGILFMPKSLIGWLIAVATIVFLIYNFRVIDSHSHSASDTLMNFFFRLLIIGAVYSLIAFFTSGKREI